MMRAIKAAAWTSVFVFGASLVGCTTLLGDFTVGDQVAGDGGVGGDASSGDSSPFDAADDVLVVGPGDSAPDQSADAPVEAGCGGGSQICGGQCVPKTDPKNCGTCGNDCTSLANVDKNAVTCSSTGTCVLACLAGFANCSGSVSTGCETDITTAKHCGSCNNTCTASAPVCQKSGGGYACATGCSGATPDLCGTTCTNLTNDPNNCGQCGTGCKQPVNGVATCANKACGFTCNAGFHACGGNCYADNDPLHCGAACSACAAPANATAACTNGACGYACNGGYTACGGACYNLTNDPANCGQCGKACAAPQGSCTNSSCSCPSAAPNYCAASNSCVDFASDPKNCGSCNHDCLGGACAGGQCQPLSLVTNGGGNSRGISAYQGSAYFGDGTNGASTVNLCTGNCGGAPKKLFTGNNVQTVFFDPQNSDLYFTDANANTVYAQNANGGALWASTGQANAEGLTSDASYLYWGASGALVRANKTDGTGVTTWGSGLNFVVALAFDGSQSIFIADYAAVGRIARCGIAAPCGTTWSTFAANVPYPTGVTASAGSVFWSFLGNPGNNYADGGVMKCVIGASGCSSTTPIAVGASYGFASSITSDPNNVYFHGNGSIWRCSVNGCNGSPTLLASNVGTARSISNDATAIYWTLDGGTVMKLAK